MKELTQPVLSQTPESGHSLEDTLSLDEFLSLLKEEEDYWDPDQQNTRLMITKLRKIFYDQWGWNKELIRGAADIEQRYIVTVVDASDGEADIRQHDHIKRYAKDHTYHPKKRIVTYSDHDRVYGDTRGTGAFYLSA